MTVLFGVYLALWFFGCVGVCMCGFCNECAYVCVGFVMCGCVYVWVL